VGDRGLVGPLERASSNLLPKRRAPTLYEPAAMDAPLHEAAPESTWALIREALRGSTRDLTRLPLGRAIFLLALPMVLEMIWESLFAVVDIYWVGKIGPQAVATVGLTEQMMVVGVFTTAMGLSIGCSAIVSRRIGEKDHDGAARAAVHGIFLGVILALVVGA